MDMNSSIEHIRDLLNNSKRPILFFDSDCDGGMSYFQLKSVWKNLEGYPMSKSENSQKRCTEFIEEDHDLVLFFDTPEIFEFMFEYAQGKKVVWVDHHPGNDKELGEKYGVFHFNPLFFDEKDGRASCYWAYLISNSKDNLWRVAVGSVSDFYLFDILIDFYEHDGEKFRQVFGLSDEKREELFNFLRTYDFRDKSVHLQRVDWIMYLTYETRVGMFKQLFDFMYKMKVGVSRSLKSLLKMEPIDVIGEVGAGKGFLFEDFSLFMSKQKKHLRNALEKNKGREFAYFEHKGKTSYNRQVIEEMAYRLKEAKCIQTTFFKKGSASVGCSFRGRENFVINDLIKEAIKGLDGQGGGHPQSGGCHVAAEDYPIFKKRFDELVEKRLKGEY